MSEIMAADLKPGQIVMIEGLRAIVVSTSNPYGDGEVDARFFFEQEPALHKVWSPDEMVNVVGVLGENDE
jgi:hypothetical protein